MSHFDTMRKALGICALLADDWYLKQLASEEAAENECPGSSTLPVGVRLSTYQGPKAIEWRVVYYYNGPGQEGKGVVYVQAADAAVAVRKAMKRVKGLPLQWVMPQPADSINRGETCPRFSGGGTGFSWGENTDG